MTRHEHGSSQGPRGGDSGTLSLDLQESIYRAREAYGLGRLSEAAAICHAVIGAAPGQPDAEALLGAIAFKQHRYDAAASHFEIAVQSCPRVAEFRYNLGLALVRVSKSEAAAEQFGETLALAPDFVPAHINLANLLRNSGEPEGALLHSTRAIQLAPRSEVAWLGHGRTLELLNRSEECVDAYRKAVSLEPKFTEAWVSLGQALQRARLFEQAEAAYVAALREKPAMPKVHYNLGGVLCAQQRELEAIASFRSAIEIDPSYWEAHYALAWSLRKLSLYEAAVEAARGAIAAHPKRVKAHALLGMLLLEQGLLDDAIDNLRRGLALAPDEDGHSALIWALSCHPDYDARVILDEARRWESNFARPLYPRAPVLANDPSPDRRLRVAYLSADFKRHPVGFFLAPVIREHDRDAFEILCFASVPEPDDLTQRLMADADSWLDASQLDDEALASAIRDARVDILVDLAGHTRGNRLLTLARRAAPVQVCAGGHYCTTGVEAVDYLVSDWHETPPGTEKDFSERLLRLPNGYVCYEPPDYAPAVAELPARVRGYVTFCCYNGLHKVTPRVLDLWADIMNAVADSRLRMQTGAFKDPATRRRYRDLLAARGIGADRVELHGPVSHVELMKSYGHADIALDPFPYSGGLTTCESLWMGVPVITLSGSTYAGRHGETHLNNVGFCELVTNSERDYVNTAVALARNLEKLAQMRRRLRVQMAASPLCDGARYTRDLERALRDAWLTWCASR